MIKQLLVILFGEAAHGEPVNNNPTFITTHCETMDYNEWCVRFRVSSRVSINRYS